MKQKSCSSPIAGPATFEELRNVAEQLVVLEKSEFIDTEKLQKYLKGRRRTGLADNLPVLADKESSSSNGSFGDKDKN
ncbi:MAG: hypothetical protein U5J63_02265 [Fodinibius sp.]|nr:hypothetical protein [Fodinibius sp.]